VVLVEISTVVSESYCQDILFIVHTTGGCTSLAVIVNDIEFETHTEFVAVTLKFIVVGHVNELKSNNQFVELNVAHANNIQVRL